MSLLHTPPNRVAGKSVQLMTTCLCDAFYADVARATVEVLEYLGCDIELPDGQTCCGQPAFNAGDWDASRKVVRHTVKTSPAKSRSLSLPVPAPPWCSTALPLPLKRRPTCRR